jgi:hypothetical protein
MNMIEIYELTVDELDSVTGGVPAGISASGGVGGTVSKNPSGGGFGWVVSGAELGKLLASVVNTLVTSPP